MTEASYRLSAACKRRALLRRWLRERPAHSGLTIAEIIDVSAIYEGHGQYDRCYRDLIALWDRNQVLRMSGRPARWLA